MKKDIKINNIVKLAYFFLTTLVLISFNSCKKMIETKPPGELIAEEAINNTDDLQKLLNNAYSETANVFGGFSQSMAEMMGDNLRMPANNDYKEVYNHNVLFFNTTSGALYSNIYRAIFRANYVEKNYNNASDLSETDKNRMASEVSFLRALLHFEAIKLYAQPYGFSSTNSHMGIAYAETAENKPLPRLTVQESYDKIIADAKKAETGLPISNGNYATKHAAQALLAQIYFQMGDYSNAGDYADKVITNSGLQFSDTTNIFSPKAYTEHVFSIVSTPPFDSRSGSFNGNYASGNPLCQLDLAVYNSLKDTSDLRISNHLQEIDPNTPKAIVVSRQFDAPFFNIPLSTITQMKLIRAESYGKQNKNLNIAIDDVNDIIARAYTNTSRILPTNATATQILAETRYQRRRELLFTGDRYNEIKRLGAIENQNIIVRTHPWNCAGFVLQFPVTERTSIFPINQTGGCQ